MPRQFESLIPDGAPGGLSAIPNWGTPYPGR